MSLHIKSEYDYWKIYFDVEKLKQENDRLREALGIYATRTNWGYGESGDDSGNIVFKYNSNDGCYFAKKALESSQ